MRNYAEINSQEDMDRLFGSIAHFHDSMTKEIHLVNRGFVSLEDKGMDMGHRYDAQVLIQSQWAPFAIELLFTDILELQLGEAGDYWGATGVFESLQNPIETRRITMSFDSDMRIVSANLAFRIRSDWLGRKTFLKSEVPSIEAIPAIRLDGNWRQCSNCKDAWEAEPSEEFSFCPSCWLLTQLI